MSTTSNTVAIPADDPRRNLVVRNPDDSNAQHLGVVGDTYTILLSGTDTAGRFTLIDMHVPPGGGPPPHRHDFEETFILLDGELQATFRGEKRIARAGETIHIPANAPHQFHNVSSKPVRMLCICSPAGYEEFFKELGTAVATRTTPPPKVDAAQEAAFIKTVIELVQRTRSLSIRSPQCQMAAVHPSWPLRIISTAGVALVRRAVLVGLATKSHLSDEPTIRPSALRSMLAERIGDYASNDADWARVPTSAECRITRHPWEGLFLREPPVR